MKEYLYIQIEYGENYGQNALTKHCKTDINSILTLNLRTNMYKTQKLIIIFLITSLFGYGTLFAQTGENSLQPREFTILDGTVTLEIQKFITPFYGISFRITDMNINMQSGGYFEVRKKGNFYIVNDRRYRDLNRGIETYFRSRLQRFCNDYYGDKDVLWTEFVKEGGLQFFMDILNYIIDDEFLNAPSNDRYG
jgi:hypothetical protein